MAARSMSNGATVSEPLAEGDETRVVSLSRWLRGQDWRLGLAHDAPDHVLILLTRGQGRMILDGARRGVSTNNLISVPPRTLHAVGTSGPVAGFIVHVPDPASAGLPDTPVHLRLRDVTAISELTGYLEAAAREAGQSAPFRAEAIAAYVALTSVFIRRQMRLPINAQPPGDAATRLTARFFQSATVPEHVGLAMQDHADRLGVTPTHLSRACKSATGKTAADILTERSVHAARLALSQTQVPVQDIAKRLGFASPAYFTRFVQAHTGMTPTALRANASAASLAV